MKATPLNPRLTHQGLLQVVEQAPWDPRCVQQGVLVLHLLGLCVEMVLGAASLVQVQDDVPPGFLYALRVVCLGLFAP